MSKAPESDSLVGQVLDDRYKVVREIAVGGMSTVFEAKHVKIGRSVAIKVLHRELASEADVVARFIIEARTVGSLGHPNIVASTDFGELPGRVPYQVLEYLSGNTVSDEVASQGPLPIRRVARIALQVASALEAAHARGIVHRDLKSDNVFLVQNGAVPDHVKVLDFGVSKFLFATGSHPKTRRGVTMGTPEFMAPEQISDPDAVDARTDIYALGVIMYHMLSGRTPFGRLPLRALLSQIILHPPPPLDRPGIPDGVRTVVLKALSKNPQDRFANMREMALELQRFSSFVFPSEPHSGPGVAPDHRGDSGPDISAIPDGSAIFRTPTLPRALATPAKPAHSPSGSGSISGTAATARRTLETQWWRRPRHAAMVAAAAAAGALVVSLAARSPEPARSRRPAQQQAARAVAARSQAAREPARPAPVVSPPPAPEPRPVRLEFRSTTPRARVTMRGQTHDLPYVEEVRPGSQPEIVELSAQGRAGKRFWITFDRPIKLSAELAAGRGVIDATGEETLFALGGPHVDQMVAGADPAGRRQQAGPLRRTITGRSRPADGLAGRTASAPEAAVPARATEARGASASARAVPPSPPPSAPSPSPSRSASLAKVDAPPAPSPPVPAASRSEAAPVRSRPPAPPASAPPPASRGAAAGSLDPSQTQALVHDHLPEIQQCYERGRMDDPELAGRVTVRIHVSPTGAVTAAAVESSSLGDSRVEACVVNTVRGWRFPEPIGGTAATISYPFNFH